MIEALSLLGSHYEGKKLSLTIAGANLMGPDSYLQDLVAKASKLPFAVDFVGHQGDINQLLKEHDVLVHASIRPEPFGQVIVQGLSAQLAVIASDAGGPAEVLRHGKSGLLHKAGDARDLAAQIDVLLNDPDYRIALQLAGPSNAVPFSDSAVVGYFDEELNIALREHQLRR